MMSSLYPHRLLSSDEFAQLQAALDGPMDELIASYGDFSAQLILSTATWGLDAWEKAVGIPTDISRPDDARREAVCAKLRGGGTTNAAAVEAVAASFSGGEVIVTEYPGEYRIKVKFVGQYGTPQYLSDVTAAINAVIPAHIAFAYEFSYYTVSQVAGMTIAQLAAATLDKFGGA